MASRRSFEVNEKLAEQAGFDPTDDSAKKTSVIWVYASELNRAFFSLWNPVQLGLGVLTLVVLVVRCPRAGALIPVILAIGITAALTFYLAPELVSQGRALDFVPRDPEPAKLGRFSNGSQALLGTCGGQGDPAPDRGGGRRAAARDRRKSDSKAGRSPDENPVRTEAPES